MIDKMDIWEIGFGPEFYQYTYKLAQNGLLYSLQKMHKYAQSNISSFKYNKSSYNFIWIRIEQQTDGWDPMLGWPHIIKLNSGQ